MKAIRMLAQLLLLLPTFCGAAAETTPAGSVGPLAGYERVVERLRRSIQDELNDKQIPAFSLALVQKDRIVWAEGFGHRDAQRTTPATANTVYRMGSISKLITDIAVMRLVEHRTLSLDVPVQGYLPDFAPRNPDERPITLRQLMSHRSGLVRESPVGNYFDPDQPTLQATVNSLNQTSLVYAPETKSKYSNAAVAVVGYVLQRTQGVPFAQWIDESVLQPLGMRQSGFELSPRIEKDLATAWMWTYDGRRFEAPRFALGTAPAGNLYSTVLDLSKLLVAIFQDGRGPRGPLLQPETLKMMISPGNSAAGDALSYGIGFRISQLDGQRMIGHGGAVYGFSSQLAALPDDQLGVVAVSSLDGSNAMVRRICDYALRLMRARTKPEPLPKLESTAPIPLERAAQLAGRYRRGNESIEVSQGAGRLWIRQGSLRRELRWRDGEMVTDDVLGSRTRIRHPSADRLVIDNVSYERVVDVRPAEIPHRWKGLIGEYGWDHNTLYILEDHGQLFALIEWFYYYPLKELGRNEFAFPNNGLYHGEKLFFSRDDQDTATEVVAASVSFPRRHVGTREGETFRIEPVKPVELLRRAALNAEPPQQPGKFLPPDLVDLTQLDPTIQLDIRYATTNNFMGTVFYQRPQALMQRPAAEAVVRVHRNLKQEGLGLLIHDAYRPWYVTKMFWDATPQSMKKFVANPANGSRHNRGCAVDLTLFDLATGRPVPMVAGYDEFSPRSFPDYPGGTSRQRWHRQLLRSVMQDEGFTIYEYEWWHFDYTDWKRYPILNVTFENVSTQ